jgi:acyl-CoA synthetase (NDP forming)
MTPRSIAIVGASPKRNTPGNHLVADLPRGGFAGEVYPVNPKYDEIEGLTCYRSIADVPGPVDLVALTVANHRLEEQLKAAIAAGVRAAVIYASCYLEDDGSPPLLDRLRRLAKEANMEVCGGNCMGYYNFDANLRMCAFAVYDEQRSGPIALISHSGSAFGSMLDLSRQFACNIAVSSGQEITTAAADYLDFALDMPSTRVAALFIETVRRPAAFAAALDKAAERRIPVVVLKVGRTEKAAKFALSHSGAIVGSDAAFQAVCDRHGVVRVETLDDLIATCQLLASPRRVASGGITAILDSGGQRELLVDLASDIGVPIAEIGEATTRRLAERLEFGLEPVNPCDAWGTGLDYEAVFGDCLTALTGDPASGIALICADIRASRWISQGYVRRCEAAFRATDRPVGIATVSSRPRYDGLADEFAEIGIPVLDGLAQALTAVRNAFAWRDFLNEKRSAPPPPPADEVIARWRTRLGAGGTLDEAEGLALLADFGVPTLPARVVEDRDAAVAAAGELGYPVALKTAADGIHHKSDVGGVMLALGDEAAVADAYDDFAGRLGPRVLVAPMAAPGVEMALGITVDAQFGPLVMVGAGGVLIEVMGDSRFAIPPFGDDVARRLIDGLKVRRLLDGVRGAPAADMAALAAAVARFSVLAATLGDVIGELDVNPLIAGADGCVAVDALVVAKPPDPSHPGATEPAASDRRVNLGRNHDP